MSTTSVVVRAGVPCSCICFCVCFCFIINNKNNKIKDEQKSEGIRRWYAKHTGWCCHYWVAGRSPSHSGVDPATRRSHLPPTSPHSAGKEKPLAAHSPDRPLRLLHLAHPFAKKKIQIQKYAVPAFLFCRRICQTTGFCPVCVHPKILTNGNRSIFGVSV